MYPNPMLACRGVDLSLGDSLYLLSIVLLWGLALIALVPNMLLIATFVKKPSAIITHLTILAAYVGGTFALFTGSVFRFDQALGIFLIFAVPAMAVVQFIWLGMLWLR